MPLLCGQCSRPLGQGKFDTWLANVIQFVIHLYVFLCAHENLEAQCSILKYLAQICDHSSYFLTLFYPLLNSIRF